MFLGFLLDYIFVKLLNFISTLFLILFLGFTYLLISLNFVIILI